MKLLKIVAILSLSLAPLTSFAQANDKTTQSSAFYQVPFHNVAIMGGQKIRASYKFSTNQTLVCTQSTDFIESIEWEYKDVWYKGQMPLTLNDNLELQGQRADSDGTLTITNEFGDPDPTSPMLVSCEYHNMK